jgi:menaquinone-dependent protoporphyrinogen oxidase
MDKVLILFSSFDGQTAQIAERVGAHLARSGHAVSVVPLGDHDMAALVARHDAVIVAGAVHYGHHARALEEAVRAHRAALEARPNAFFSVSMAAARPGKGAAEAQAYVADFVERTGWQPRATATFAGALRYSRYNLFVRFMMRLISGTAGGDTDTSRDHEYTDWAAVERFARELVRQLEPAAVPA